MKWICSSTSLQVTLCHFSALRSVAAQWRDAESRALLGADDGSLSLWRLESSECLARRGQRPTKAVFWPESTAKITGCRSMSLHFDLIFT